jgi:transposase
VPAIPSCIIGPIWDQLQALLPPRSVVHPLGCHRPRVPDRIVFDKLVQVLVFGCAYERIADTTCSATTLRRRRDEWIATGVMDRLQALTLDAYVDPPRTGLSREVMAGLLRLSPPRLVYVSCDVATLARDTRLLHSAGYRLDAIVGLDLFPNTAHVETIAAYTR